MKKFTQEVKDAWLEALKSGNFKQGYGTLVDTEGKETRHCCIGVLADVHPELSNDSRNDSNCPYKFLDDTIGNQKTNELWKTNDGFTPELEARPKDYKDDYSNVIPLIEALPVQD